jgi:hypothetical protein
MQRAPPRALLPRALLPASLPALLPALLHAVGALPYFCWHQD